MTIALDQDKIDFRAPLNLLPINAELEEAVLGAILADPEAIALIQQWPPIAAFQISTHKKIYQAMLEIHQQSGKIDIQTVALKLQALGILAEAGGKLKLSQLVDRCVASIHLDHHIDLLCEAHAKAQAVATGKQIAQALAIGDLAQAEQLLQTAKGAAAKATPDERLRLEIQAYSTETDPIKRLRLRSEIAQHYRIKSSEIDEVARAIKILNTTAEVQLHTLDDVFSHSSEGLQWLIPELLPIGETVVLAGPPKGGKTLLAIDAAFAVATGESNFLGETVKQGKVLLVSADESLQSTKNKLLKRGFRLSDSENIRVLPKWDISQILYLETILDDFRPDLVVIDSLRRINHNSQISENSAEFADQIYTLKECLGRYKASGILIHHTSKDKEAMGVHQLRGSSAIAGAAWGTWLISQTPKQDPETKKLVIDPKDPNRILTVFSRDTEGQQLRICFEPEDNSWSLVSSPDADAALGGLKERIIRILQLNPQGLSGKDIIELLEALPDEAGSIYTTLNRMYNRRIVSAKPALDNRRFTIYSLPGCSVPPPPPPPTDPDVSYESEKHTQQGLQTYNITSNTDITTSNTNEDVICDNPVLVSVSAIHNTSPVQGGGEGSPEPVICAALPEIDPCLRPGATVRNAAGWRGWVASVDPEDAERVIVEFENRISDSYPVHCLDLIQPAPEAKPETQPVLEAEKDFAEGDRVAGKDPYTVLYSYHGLITIAGGDEVQVRWAERAGKPNEYEIYSASELRRLG